MMSAKQMRAAIYARISDDREGEEAGIKRQTSDGRKLVRARGGAIVMETSDNDISALYGKKRPGYDAIMAAAKAGEITHIVVWQTSRLWRNRRERAEGIEILREAQVSVLAVKGPELDMTSAYGRGMAGLIGEFDTMESEVKAERNRRKAEELAAEGKIGGGGLRPYGYTRVYAGERPRRTIVRDEINEEEAAVIRDCARRVLAGESLRSITALLNDKGIKSSLGGRWGQGQLREMLRGGRIAGLRMHNDVATSTAVWPAIITVDEHKLLRAKLDTNERAGKNRMRLHYLTGYLQCDDPGCAKRGIKMEVASVGGALKYRCKSKQDGGCNARTIMLPNLVKMVDTYMKARMRDPNILSELAALHEVPGGATTPILAKIGDHERRLELMRQAMEEGDEHEVPEIMNTVRAIRRKLDAAKEELARVSAVPDIARLDLPALAEEWDDLHVDQKQFLLRLFVDRVVVSPSRRGINKFDPDRVDIIPVGRAAD